MSVKQNNDDDGQSASTALSNEENWKEGRVMRRFVFLVFYPNSRGMSGLLSVCLCRKDEKVRWGVFLVVRQLCFVIGISEEKSKGKPKGGLIMRLIRIKSERKEGRNE